MKHEFVLSRFLKHGGAIGTNRVWRTTSNPVEAIDLYRKGWEFEEGLCLEPCPVCNEIFNAIEAIEEE